MSNKQRVKKSKEKRICGFADCILSLFEERMEANKDTGIITTLGFQDEKAVVVTEFETLQELKDEMAKGFRLAVFAWNDQVRRFWDTRDEFESFLEHGEEGYICYTKSAFFVIEEQAQTKPRSLDTCIVNPLTIEAS